MFVLRTACLLNFAYRFNDTSSFRYDANRNEWIKAVPMSSRRLGVSVSVLDGCLYAVGGSDGQTPLNTVERFVFENSDTFG